MEIWQLKYFVAAAETGCFSQAAKRCNISQSAVSQQVKALEDELGRELFIRSTHQIVPTEAGSELMQMAYALIDGMQRCKEHVMSMDGELSGELRMGFGSFVEPYYRRVAITIAQQNPKLRINAYFESAEVLNRKLCDHEIDMAFTINRAYASEHIESMPVLTFELCAIMRKDNKLASKSKVTFDDLLKEEIIMPSTGNRGMHTIRKYYDQAIDNLNTRIVVNDTVAALTIVEDTNYITFLPELCIANNPTLCARPIEGLDARIISYAHWLKGEYHKKSAKQFLDMARKMYGEFE